MGGRRGGTIETVGGGERNDFFTENRESSRENGRIGQVKGGGQGDFPFLGVVVLQKRKRSILNFARVT